jgi:hypothetical protein
MNREEYEQMEEDLQIYYDRYVAAKNRATKLIEGPGGIMEMKQTIADKEKQITELESSLIDIIRQGQQDIPHEVRSFLMIQIAKKMLGEEIYNEYVLTGKKYQ